MSDVEKPTLDRVLEVVRGHGLSPEKFYTNRYFYCEIQGRDPNMHLSLVTVGKSEILPLTAKLYLRAKLDIPYELEPASTVSANLVYVDSKTRGEIAVLLDEIDSPDDVDAKIRIQKKKVALVDKHFSKYFQARPDGSRPDPERMASHDEKIRHYRACCIRDAMRFFPGRKDDFTQYFLPEDAFPYVLAESSELNKSMIGARKGMFFVAGDEARQTWQQQMAAFHAYYGFLHGSLPLISQVSEVSDLIETPKSWQSWWFKHNWGNYLEQMEPLKKKGLSKNSDDPLVA